MDFWSNGQHTKHNTPLSTYFRHHEGHEDIGHHWLFFGCRHAERDFLFQEELYEMHKDPAKPLHDLSLAFSRDPESEHCYVQHQMESRDDDLWQ